MKVTFTATVDLGDSFCNEDIWEEVNWATSCVINSVWMNVSDVQEDYPIKVKSINNIEIKTKMGDL